MKTFSRFAATLFLCAAFNSASAQTKVVIGISGWTGFAPLTLADKAGLFKKNGVDVELRSIPQKDRHLVLSSGAAQCAATTVETQVAWNANGVPNQQFLLLDRSHGGDGIAARPGIQKVADLKGKTVAVDAPGTASFWLLAYILKKNGMSMADVNQVKLSPQMAANAFVTGQNDAAVSYEPYLSTVRASKDAGSVLVTTRDYPVIVDTLGCAPEFIEKNPQAVKAIVDSYFDALDMIKAQPKASYAIMGAAVKQTAEQFEESAKFIRWPTRQENAEFFERDIKPFMADATGILKENNVIRNIPASLDVLYTTRFAK
ncbi:ABC transporter substrate-binding protein [Noviherbaspirillum denitrificans]|uniref:ABC transporter permease n=1 Tax=Noviherbaspirillum denitrificans TaxID=1968433 RepID=A0A254TG60_9BURK|nr:ABC transporter permease [Noviherbaspirillum denitrificans]